MKPQTDAERRAAIRTLLPLLYAPALCGPGSRVISRAPGLSEGKAEPHFERAACDEHCFGCEGGCAEEPWAALDRALRGRYPILYQLEALLEAMADIPWGHQWYMAIHRTYLDPADIFRHGPWPELAERGVGWLSERLAGEYVPTYVQPVEFRQVQVPRCERDVKIVQLRCEGETYRSIARAVRCSKSTVQAVIHGQQVRRGRAGSAPS